MDCFVKKIFDNKIDELVHIQFQKFSRGQFDNRAMVRMKDSNGNITLDTTSEYSRELVRAMAEKLGDKKTLITGAIISALDLTGFKYEERKMAMGVRKYMINREMTGKELIEICDTILKAVICLSFSVGEDELKIKDKSPKSMKGVSSTKKDDEKMKIDFCKLKTKDRKLVEGLIFDPETKGAKKIEVIHDFVITDIVIPTSLKSEKDFAIVREKALRKGKIVRKLNIDGERSKKKRISRLKSLLKYFF